MPLDAQVALVVFGSDVIQCPRNGIWGYRWMATGDIIDTKSIPCYSRDMNTAMLVVEHMRTEWGVKMWEPRRGIWAVTFADHRAESDSLPRAICESALAATRGAADSDGEADE